MLRTLLAIEMVAALDSAAVQQLDKVLELLKSSLVPQPVV